MADIVAILSAFGLGGAVGALLRAEHEWSERFRERMIVAAQDFLTASGDAVTKVEEALDRILSPDEKRRVYRRLGR